MDGDILVSHMEMVQSRHVATCSPVIPAELGDNTAAHGLNPVQNIRSRHEEIDSHLLLHLLKKESTRDW